MHRETKSLTNSQCNLPDVLATAGIKIDRRRGVIIMFIMLFIIVVFQDPSQNFFPLISSWKEKAARR
jgi:hypothetical protein